MKHSLNDDDEKLENDSDQMNPELYDKMQHAISVIKRYTSEISKLNSSQADVMQLENRTYLLENGYLDINNQAHEQANPLVDFNVVKKDNSDMLGTYSLVQMRVKSAIEII